MPKNAIDVAIGGKADMTTVKCLLLTQSGHFNCTNLVRSLVFFSRGHRERLVHSLSLATRFRSLPEELVSAAVDLAAHACPR
jgi:hypothetical protein